MITLKARLIVCEPRRHWAPQLRRWFAADAPRVEEVRDAAAVWEILGDAPASAVGWATDPQVWDSQAWYRCLAAVARQHREFPDSCAVVLGERGCRRLQAAAFEAGAQWAIVSLRELDQAARIISRHLAHFPAPAPTEMERIWAGLPWPQDTHVEE